MGRQKLLLPYAGTTVIGFVVDTLLEAGIDHVLVVTGHDREGVERALADRPVSLVHNRRHAEGMLSSVRCGLCALPDTCHPILFALGDQPGISTPLVRRLIRVFEQSTQGIVVPVHRGRRGHPLVFAQAHAAEVLHRFDDVGLRGLLSAYPHDIQEVQTDDPAVLEDMDTPEDYRRVSSTKPVLHPLPFRIMKTSLSRRQFLQTAVGAAGAGLVLPASGLRAQAPPSDRVNVALIGCGSRMNALQGELLRIPEARIVAAADPFEARRRQKAEASNQAYGGTGCRMEEDFRTLLADDDIDAVVVATPDHWHVPVAIAAARAGKDMYVEKPLGLSMPRAALLRREVEQRNLIFQYGTQQHSSLFSRMAMELVWNGYVGKIQRCDVWSPALGPQRREPIASEPVPEGLNYDLWLGPAPEAPYSTQRVTNTGGVWHCYDYALGFIAGWGAHPIDILQWGLEMEHTSPVTYQGTGVMPEDAQLLNTLRTWDLQLEYENGITARFLDSGAAKPEITSFHSYFRDNGVVFHGTEGWVCHSRGAAYAFRNGKYVNVSQINYDEFPKRAPVSPGHMRNFIESVRSRKAPVSPLPSAINGDAISHLGNIAARTGRKITYDPATLSIPGDSALNRMLTRPMRDPYSVG